MRPRAMVGDHQGVCVCALGQRDLLQGQGASLPEISISCKWKNLRI